MNKPKLICLTGPTAVGKTELAIQIAEELNTEIISCDSRQIYREMTIGTAVPDPHQLTRVQHHFIQCVSVRDYYSVFKYETEALKILEELFKKHDTVILSGGSGLYLDALLFGVDDIPDPDPETRIALAARLKTEGLDGLKFELKRLDPVYYQQVDIRNPNRILRGLEVCLTTGRPFSSFRKNKLSERPFDSHIICLNRERSVLHHRINQRVDQMIQDGLVDEARTLYPLKELNALKTVGYRELFNYFDGQSQLHEAIGLIKRNTRRYARRQITWNNRYKDAIRIDADQKTEIRQLIRTVLSG